MHWELLGAGDWTEFGRARELPPAALEGSESPLLFAVESDKPEREWIAGPTGTPVTGTGEQVRPVGLATEAEYRTPEFWSLVLSHHPRHAADLAHYARRQELPPETFLKALGLRSDYRTRDEWQGMGALDEDTRDFARRYDFPFAVLRLWDRIAPEERQGWREIFETRVLKKNFVREIVVDLYDLAPEARGQALAEAREFSAGWQARSGTFPGDQLRDLVRARRYPQLEANRRAVQELRGELGALPAGLRLHLPADLETTRLKLELEFDSSQRLAEQIAFFTPERRALLDRMLDLL